MGVNIAFRFVRFTAVSHYGAAPGLRFFGAINVIGKNFKNILKNHISYLFSRKKV